MQARVKLALVLSSLLLAACSSSSNSPRAVPAPPATNDDGSLITGVITARFDPATSTIPTPNNLLFSGTRDLTLNIPVANPNNFGDPQVALNAQDGWSTVAPSTFSLSVAPRANSLVAGSSIRVFEVELVSFASAVRRVVRELSPNTEFVVAQPPSDTTGRTVAIVWTSPLKESSSYMVVVTDDVRDANGNDATPDTTYFLASRTSPLCVNGASTDPLIPTANACALEPLRQLTNSQQAAAAAAGVARADIVLSWVFTTQSITPVTTTLVQQNQPSTPTLARAGDLSLVGQPAIADVYIGVLPIPYYLEAPSAQNPTAVLTTFWRGLPGNYIGPFQNAGLDPTSTNLTIANRAPERRSTQNIPVLLTVPNAASGRTRPETGWPIVIFMHGISRNRTDAFAIAATFASQGFAVVAIDQPLHGLGPTGATAPFYIENTPFGPIASERTFDVDYINNTTGAPGPDGVIDPSGAHFINLSSLLTSRDNLRQATSDLITLTKSIQNFNIDGSTATIDFNSSQIRFVGQSLGAIVGTVFMSVDPTVRTGLLSVPGGGIAQLLNGSATFGPRIRAGLQAAGVVAGTPQFDQFLGAAQTAVDSADPINYGPLSRVQPERFLMHLVVGGGTPQSLPDQVVPITVPGAPLSGGEPLARVLGLQTITQTTQDANGVRGVVRFTQGDHGSLLSPAASPAVTAEMQGQMAAYIASDGTLVRITNTSVIRTQ
jgi:pimeloyl-ACP methyl ester carboxylesterase